MAADGPRARGDGGGFWRRLAPHHAGNRALSCPGDHRGKGRGGVSACLTRPSRRKREGIFASAGTEKKNVRDGLRYALSWMPESQRSIELTRGWRQVHFQILKCA